ncbi:bifunctional DNA-formamidopyrimidine glycosylase/DNA-(apurinic or apyrimidinic site) lyase [Garicola koreensis]|uniref:Formamidopyrimidine-DNA glycosylase n=1 Tax=Garicola koreensis TaxID=1262554 RepID=A0A7W5TVH3_9MICC|nr:bifunctional DNA-formamidopyrimidine glycosylase/DNA-(apurinic or apyrimidinic site) lyase [Garicola koreensis]MBB3668458.1 formamidopyrimidine-DNA glycosylase [Garicola koreensis]
MPELPEVEVVRRGVQRWAAGRRVEAVQIHDVRSLRRFAEGPEAFVRQLTGQVLVAPQRRGKFLWIPLQNQPIVLMIHLGMSGQVLIEDDDAPAQKHLKVTLQLSRAHDDDGAALPSQLRFIDQRIFGGMQLSPVGDDAVGAGPVGPGVVGPGTVGPQSGRLIPAAAAHIGPDPLESGVDAEWFFRALRRRRTGLKRALLDQTLVSGVGNIYADEALWVAALHYARRSETITRAEAARLLEALVQVMEAALAAGGTSFDALYVNVNGASGYFERSLQAYGQAGRECARCAARVEVGALSSARSPGVIVREKFMGRSSYLCPVCQPRPRNGRW